MRKKQWFTYREVSNDPLGKVIIVPKDYDDFPMNTRLGGSYSLAPARVLGLSYAEYLRMLRASFPEDVTLVGRDGNYPVAQWRKGKSLYTFIDLLNLKLTLTMSEEEKT